MNNKYNPQDFEPRFYEIWEKRGYFGLDSNKAIQNGKNFAIMMPPPNITGALHMGHALTYTLQDIITRYKRMDGYRVLWQPGIDHAGIATQNVVERRLLQQGIKKENIGREAFLDEVWKWKEESGGMILSQLRRLGASCNWERLRFTMDKGLQNAVKKAFVSWYDAGYIVQGDYMVNWCTHDGALSDIEVEYEENKGKLYYIRYYLADFANLVDSSHLQDSNTLALNLSESIKNDEKGNYIIVATTRPETYFGDTAVMINPQDSRYNHLIGKKVVLPLIGREIEIIADSYVDMEFGTGCVKVTPSHDINDYEVAKRHNLAHITIFDKNGILNNHCGKFAGLERLKARELIIKALQEGGFIEKIEEHTNNIGKCYRCGNIVEPYISRQWFVKKEIAAGAIAKINNANARFYPPQWINNYNAWMNDLRDWCISRQLWWGHRIPVFYCDMCGIKIASVNERESCAKCGAQMRQDEDVLDTWFSSGLWAFSTLGWGNINPNDTKEETSMIESLYNSDDLGHFYPNSLLITSFDILFFWVARMLLSGENLLGKLPFRDIYLHALICDEFGQKMSKSKGNVINPLEMIERHSSDILRFSLAYYCIQGRDIRISDKSFDIGNTLFVKIINALQFLLMYQEQQGRTDFVPIESTQTPLGNYIKYRFYQTTLAVRNALDQYRFNDAANAIYRFLIQDFCDWGIEFVKAQKSAVFELGGIFSESMKLLHPFMPFVSEFIWQSLRKTTLENADSIMIEVFPNCESIESKNFEFSANIESFDIIKDIITCIRRAKITLDYANKSIPLAFVKPHKNVDSNLIATFVPKLAKCEKIEIVENKMPRCVFDIGESSEIYIPTDSINIEQLRDKLHKKEEKITLEIQKLESMLNNEKFIKNAPKDLIQNNTNALNEARAKKEKIKLELEHLKWI